MRVSPANVYRATQSWLFEPQPAHAMVAGRIIFGVVLFLCYAVRLPDAAILYAADGFGGPEFIQQLVPSGTIFQAVYDGLDFNWRAPGPNSLRLLFSVAMLCALSFACGYRTRTSGWIIWLIHLYFYKLRLPLAYWGWPALMQGFMMYVLLSRAGDFFSVDAWLARRRDGTQAPPVTEWLGRLVGLHRSARTARISTACPPGGLVPETQLSRYLS